MTDVPAGKIDLHAHLLPGVDDGCQSVRESLECIRLMEAAGFVGSVCTPHFGRDLYPETRPERVTEWVQALREALSGEGSTFRLWSGAEVRLAASTVTWLEEVGVPTLGDGRTVLVDYWGRFWPDYATATCRYLIDQGYDVLLAHPERMELMATDVEEVVAELEALGVRLQGNLHSLSGGEGIEAAEASRRWLQSGRYVALASDTHSPWGMSGRVAGIRTAEGLVGSQVVRLLEEEPRRILGLGVAGA